MGHYPAIREFVQDNAPSVKNLDVTYTQGAPPLLFMKDAEGAVLEEVNIANWKVRSCCCVSIRGRCAP